MQMVQRFEVKGLRRFHNMFEIFSATDSRYYDEGIGCFQSMETVTQMITESHEFFLNFLKT